MIDAAPVAVTTESCPARTSAAGSAAIVGELLPDKAASTPESDRIAVSTTTETGLDPEPTTSTPDSERAALSTSTLMGPAADTSPSNMREEGGSTICGPYSPRINGVSVVNAICPRVAFDAIPGPP